MKQFVDRDFCADYKYSTSIDVVHEECQQYATINDMFDEVDVQTLLDCRTDCLYMELKEQTLKCKYCVES